MWCDAHLGQYEMPEDSAGIFCSWRCEIAANSWLYREMLAIAGSQSGNSHGDDFDSR
jgi:hypothetical protein